MNSEREQAYLNLINQLLTCPSGEEAEVLETHLELRDDGLVAAMLEEAENLRRFGQLNNANRLMNCAGILLGMNDNTSVAVTRQAEAERLFEQGNQQYKISQFREALHSWGQALTICRKIGNRQGEAAVLCQLGAAYQSLGQFHRAIEFHQQYLEISREIGDRVGESISLNNLGNTFLKTHQLAEAETALRASIAIHETLRSELVSNDHKVSIFETQISSYRLLQQVLVAQTRFDEALEISEMSRTRAFVELWRQTLLTTPPQSPPIEERTKSYLNSSLLSPPLARGGWGGYQDLRKKQTSQSPPLARGSWGGYQFPKSNKSPATETPQ
jgi:tetratricopeptide (TPR) repeat protein